MAPFQGRLLVGVGRLLRIYDIGKKKMLRKCENKHLPNLVVDIRCMGNRIYVSDVQEAVHFVRYKPQENQLIIFADETYQRLVCIVGTHVHVLSHTPTHSVVVLTTLVIFANCNVPGTANNNDYCCVIITHCLDIKPWYLCGYHSHIMYRQYNYTCTCLHTA